MIEFSRFVWMCPLVFTEENLFSFSVSSIGKIS
ncbi:hypothetical protein EG68_00031 [Paragonimus skrjabini miyazakii]|uniref:Uncharacterized protein n=1 Tax=Paragonimus skrjabini miyazakii TaxID=59628 RepID=A0A8S9Z7T5_9TREM|nr:hypothetical protein EG68_00031 [Paragonimus skrjabini miyazakii]